MSPTDFGFAKPISMHDESFLAKFATFNVQPRFTVVLPKVAPGNKIPGITESNRKPIPEANLIPFLHTTGSALVTDSTYVTRHLSAHNPRQGFTSRAAAIFAYHSITRLWIISP